jgi:hypothetical protein
MTRRGLYWAVVAYLVILAMLGGSLYALYQITHTLGELQ